MDLTPHDIQEKQFHNVFRGYSAEEVDEFLDEIAEAFAKAYRENQGFHERLRELEDQLREARATEAMLKRTLLTAQRTAEEAVDEARAKARGITAAAERKAQEIVAAAERRAHEIAAAAQVRGRDLEIRVEALKLFEQEYRARLRAFIESQLKVLADGPPRPGGEAAAGHSERAQPRATPPARPPKAAPAEYAPAEDAPADPAAAAEPEAGDPPRASGAAAVTGPDPSAGSEQAPPVSDEPDPALEGRSVKELFWGES